MKCLLQRVTQASVTVAGEVVGEIDRGLLVLVGVEPEDTEQTVTRMAERLLRYRVFADAEGKMNLNVAQAGGAMLLVSQFTLAADTTSGNRPGFSTAAPPEQASELCDALADPAHAHAPHRYERHRARRQNDSTRRQGGDVVLVGQSRRDRD